LPFTKFFAWKLLNQILMCSSFLVFCKVLCFLSLSVRWKFLSSNWVKINIDGVRLLGDILVLLLVEVFFVGVWKNLLKLFLCFLKFRLHWLLSFMGLYMLWRKLKRWDLLMFDWNVILFWFLLCLLLWQMFKLANLGFIHRESFHWYSRFPSSLFLKFFMNTYVSFF